MSTALLLDNHDIITGISGIERRFVIAHLLASREYTSNNKQAERACPVSPCVWFVHSWRV